MNNEETQPKEFATHGGMTEFDGNDGVHRKIQIERSNLGNFILTYRTFWDGPENPPLETSIKLGRESMSLTSAMIFDFLQNMSRFTIIRPGESPRAEELTD